MKRGLFFVVCLCMIFSISVVFAELNISKEVINPTMVFSIYEPASYNITFTNLGEGDVFSLYNLLGFRMQPLDSFSLGNGEYKSIIVKMYPKDDFTTPGNYNIEYFIKGERTGVQNDQLFVKVVSLDETLLIDAEPFYPTDKYVNLIFENREPIFFERIDGEFHSEFFDAKQNFTLYPKETKVVRILIDQQKSNKLFAGKYISNNILTIRDQELLQNNMLDFVENVTVASTKSSEGFIFRKTMIVTMNDGNVLAPTTLHLRKNIITRLISGFTPEPSRIDRGAFYVDYIWEKQLAPGETFDVVVTTNLLFPFFLIILIIVVVILAKLFSYKSISLTKSVSFVRVKGGEFALRVTLNVKANQYVEHVHVADPLPALVKIHSKFDREMPKRFDHNHRRIEWEFDSLQKGEVRVMQYYVYSKFGVLGKFALPAASAFFSKEGVMHEVQSNKAFFVTDQLSRE